MTNLLQILLLLTIFTSNPMCTCSIIFKHRQFNVFWATEQSWVAKDPSIQGSKSKRGFPCLAHHAWHFHTRVTRLHLRHTKSMVTCLMMATSDSFSCQTSVGHTMMLTQVGWFRSDGLSHSLAGKFQCQTPDNARL